MDKKEKLHYLKIAVLYLALSAGLIFLILQFGVVGAIKISEIFQKDKGGGNTETSQAIIPAPQLIPLPQATNSAELPIRGYSSANQKVEIFLNDMGTKTLDVNSEGSFEDFLSLSLGVNKIYAITKDAQERQGPPSSTWEVFFSDIPPAIEVTEPANNSQIKKARNITIKGKILSSSKVYINDHLAIVDSEGNFSSPFKLENGENKIKIVCADPAENKTELEWVINFQP